MPKGRLLRRVNLKTTKEGLYMAMAQTKRLAAMLLALLLTLFLLPSAHADGGRRQRDDGFGNGSRLFIIDIEPDDGGSDHRGQLFGRRRC